MTVEEIMSQLRALGNDKMIAMNKKNGVGENQFGVKLGDIRTLANKVKTNHALAMELWATENLEARLLACLVMKPKTLSKEQLDSLVKSIQSVPEADWVNANVVKDHPEKNVLREEWLRSKNKWAARAGWSITAGLIARSPDQVDVDQLLDRIAAEMPGAAPEIQWTMNTALAYIGIHHASLRKRALEIGEQLGMYRDYPVSKGCTSPFAPIWISEMVSRQTK